MLPAVLVALLGGSYLCLMLLESLGWNFIEGDVSVWSLVGLLLVMTPGILAAYVVGNVVEGESLSDTLVEVLGPILAIVVLVIGLALIVALVALFIYLARNMPLWATVLATLLVFISVMLAVLVRAIVRKKE